MGSAFALIGLAIKYGPLFVHIVKLLAPVLREAGPVFQQLSQSGMSEDEAAQKAVALKAPYIKVSRAEEKQLEDRLSAVF